MNTNRVLSINPLNVLAESGFGLGTMQHISDCHSEPHRHYHDMGHVKEMLACVEPSLDRLSMNEAEALQLAIVWHDSVYNPLSKTNEEESFIDFLAEYEGLEEKYRDLPKWQAIIPMVQEMIMATKHHEYSQDMPLYLRLIIEADLARFGGTFETFWQNTMKLFREYSNVDWDAFKNGRIAFLKDYAKTVQVIVGQEGYDNCMKSAAVLSVWEPKIGIYAGSFDPYHTGHQRIKEKAERIFDKVIIARGTNPGKPNKTYDIPQSLRETNQVDAYLGWITDYIKSKKYNVTLIRGLRNGSDLNGEINLERYLRDLMPDIQIIAIFADADVEHISSSGIKELIKSAGDDNKIPDYIIN